MSRDSSSKGRPVVVWGAVTAAAAIAATVLPGSWHAAASGVGAGRVVDVVVAGCALALCAALAWLWAVTTATVVGLLTGRLREDAAGATRRLVLAACGVAVVAGTATPAVADGPELLVGLALPERAVEPAPPTPSIRPSRRPGPAVHVVRSGDSLWSIARAHPDGGSVEARWRAIWRANRGVVGDDPDLILPGQVLRLPDQQPRQQPDDKPDEKDGAR
ncbi:LysM domain-containing protein [Nocardioides sp. zg-1308]|uniref:LysM peptidoglycan-binding domain-containing protein n=1 Tax=Nocardioides sp. zg-1308 TaxID=2736253 RepID=UPI001C131838